MKVFFIDPNSYNNLQIYDDRLMKSVGSNSEMDLTLFGNILFNEPECGFYKRKLIYSYSDKKGMLKGFSYVLSQFFLLFSMLVGRPNVIHIQWIKLYRFDFILFKIAKVLLPKCKFVYTVHNILPHDSGDTHFTVFRKVYKLMDSLIVHNAQSKDILVEKFKLNEYKIAVIPHGLLDYKCIDAFASNLFDKKEGEITFILAGRLNRYKGFDLLADCWKTYFASYSNIRLILAGDGDIKAYDFLNELSNVTVINRFLTDAEFIYAIKSSDVVLLPYREISQSGVLLTVLNEKKPIIVSNLPGLTEPFQHGRVGWIIEKLDIEGIRDCILLAIEDLSSTFSIDNHVWDRIREYYSWQNIGDLTSVLYLKK